MRRRPEFTAYNRPNPTVLTERALIVLLVGAWVLGVIGGISFWRYHPRTVDVVQRVVQTTTPTCDPALVAADLQVLRFGYEQLLAGHRKLAVNEVGANYAAIGAHECQPAVQ